MVVWPGTPFPLGPVWDGAGTNFSLFSENAERVELCLFDGAGHETRVSIDRAHRVQLALLSPRRRAGQLYGYRVDGPYDPASAGGSIRTSSSSTRTRRRSRARRAGSAANVLPYVPIRRPRRRPRPRRLRRRGRDPEVRRRRPALRLGGRPPAGDAVARHRHLRGAHQGFTQRHPHVRDDLRGTYAGLASEPALAYLRELGVTAVELLPIHHIADEQLPPRQAA